MLLGRGLRVGCNWRARLVLAAGLIGIAIAPAWAQPGTPDIRGTYPASGTVALSGCTNTGLNIQAGLAATVDVGEQVDQEFVAAVTGTLSGLPVPGGVGVTAVLVGVVAPDGTLGGDLSFAILVGGNAIAVGTGTFTGKAENNSITVNISGEVDESTIAQGCKVAGSLTGSRPTTVLTAAVLPGSRSVQVGATATVFAVILNAGQAEGLSCKIAPLTGVPADFTFWTTDPATNAVTGEANVAADIPAGGSQTFLLAFTPTAEFPPTAVQLSFACANAPQTQVIPGVNTLLLSASTTPVPDVVALAATLNNDGIVNIPGETGTGIFAVASVNVGAGGNITVTTDTGGVALPIQVSLCQTNPFTGDCISSIGSSVVTQINANATPTFAVFVKGNGLVEFDPATKRIYVLFKIGAVTHGATSVAVRTAP